MNVPEEDVLPELLTVTVQEPYFVSSTVEVALMVVLPTATAETVPLELTVATFSLPEVHVTVCAGLFVPVTVADKLPVVVPFKSRLNVAGETVTELTVGAVALTVIVHVAETPL